MEAAMKWLLCLVLATLVGFGGCDNKKGPPPPTPTTKAIAGVNATTPASDPSLPSAATATAALPDASAPAR
jgi:hypothetical protein